MLFTSFSSVALESHVELDDHKHLSHNLADNNANVSNDHECPDCNVGDCSAAAGCCSGVCVCVTTFFNKSKKHLIESNNSKLGKLSCFYNQEYNSPSLDPALKPPLFS